MKRPKLTWPVVWIVIVYTVVTVAAVMLSGCRCYCSIGTGNVEATIKANAETKATIKVDPTRVEAEIR